MESSKKRIAKNTLFLYGRMILLMVVSLYTSRVVLNALGIIDFGLYNVIGGVVTFVGFLNSSLTSSTQRFLNVEMAKGTSSSVNNVFCQAINTHLIIALIALLLLETIGTWFVINKLTIPTSKMNAAIWVYQCSIGSLLLTILSAPYNAAIIANEKMSIFAVLSILDAILRLSVAFIITLFIDNRLKYYALLILGVAVIMRLTYSTVCTKLFTECRYHLLFDWKIMKNMFSFSGWMIVGCLSDVLAGQGVNMLINIYFGPIFNASRAIAVQVQSAVSQFSNNFMISVNPQIVKQYSSGNKESAYNLVFQSSKLSFYLMMLIVIPLCINTNYILNIWLKEVPEYSGLFVQLILIEYLIRSTYTPIAQINVAYGKVKQYQLSIAVLFIIVFLGTYILYRFNYPIYTTFVLGIICAIIGLFTRLTILYKQNKFPVRQYLYKVSLPLLFVAILVIIPSTIIKSYLSTSTIDTIISMLSTVIISFIIIWFVGLNINEKKAITQKISSYLKKQNK